jgi:hypothetical protein
MRHIPASIYRIPLLLADSVDGVVSQFNYIHHLMRILPDCILPVMPGNSDLLFDMVSADWVAAALAWVFDFRFTEGAIRHLCAGGRGSLRLDEMMSRTCSTIERHPSYPIGRRVGFPQLVSLAEFDHFVRNRSNESQRLIAKVGHHIRFMGIRQVYLTEKAQSDLNGSGLVLPEMHRCFENALRYCLDTRWGRKPLVSEVITANAAT